MFSLTDVCFCCLSVFFFLFFFSFCFVCLCACVFFAGMFLLCPRAQNMLVFDPQRRVSAKDAMEHPYFENLNAAIKNIGSDHK